MNQARFSYSIQGEAALRFFGIKRPRFIACGVMSFSSPLPYRIHHRPKDPTCREPFLPSLLPSHCLVADFDSLGAGKAWFLLRS